MNFLEKTIMTLLATGYLSAQDLTDPSTWGSSPKTSGKKTTVKKKIQNSPIYKTPDTYILQSDSGNVVLPNIYEQVIRKSGNVENRLESAITNNSKAKKAFETAQVDTAKITTKNDTLDATFGIKDGKAWIKLLNGKDYKNLRNNKSDTNYINIRKPVEVRQSNVEKVQLNSMYALEFGLDSISRKRTNLEAIVDTAGNRISPMDFLNEKVFPNLISEYEPFKEKDIDNNPYQALKWNSNQVDKLAKLHIWGFNPEDSTLKAFYKEEFGEDASTRKDKLTILGEFAALKAYQELAVDSNGFKRLNALTNQANMVEERSGWGVALDIASINLTNSYTGDDHSFRKPVEAIVASVTAMYKTANDFARSGRYSEAAYEKAFDALTLGYQAIFSGHDVDVNRLNNAILSRGNGQ